jgi:molybdenum cofactor cytidylyltransferase
MVDIAAVVLAAGNSRRFGAADKLEQGLDGQPLALHIADTLSQLDFRWRVAVCQRLDGSVPEGLIARGFDIVVNPDPSRGQASSLALGAKRASQRGAAGMLVALADMPAVTARHLQSLAEWFAADPQRIVASVAGSYRGPPAIFPAALFETLMGLSGDGGARHLIKNASAVEGDEAEFRDFDVPEDFG